METRWFDANHTQTEAEKMVEDYNNGLIRVPEIGVRVQPAMKMEAMA